MKTNLDIEFDFHSITNLLALGDEFKRRKELKKKINKISDNIDNYVDGFIKCSMFRLDKLSDLDGIISPDDIYKFSLLNVEFGQYKMMKTASEIISMILRVRGVEHCMTWFCKTQKKMDPFRNTIFDDSEPCSIFVDFQNKTMFFIPSNIDPEIGIDYKLNKLVIKYRRHRFFDPYNEFTRNHPADMIYPYVHNYHMKCTIDMTTLKSESTEEGW
jgi:hypothetical protein